MSVIGPSGKSLANLGKAAYISVAIVAATIVRVWWGQRPNKRLVSGILILTVGGVAAAPGGRWRDCERPRVSAKR